MECDERARLLGAQNRATLAISTSINDLLPGVGAISSIIYDIRRHAMARARIEFEAARLAYEDHVEEHGCETSNLAGTKVVNCAVVARKATYSLPQSQRENPGMSPRQK
jgi:hypothetical protein